MRLENPTDGDKIENALFSTNNKYFRKPEFTRFETNTSSIFDLKAMYTIITLSFTILAINCTFRYIFEKGLQMKSKIKIFSLNR